MTKDEQNMFSKFCVYCQKHGHTDDECWCTRAIPPINPVITHDQTMTTNTTNSQAASIDNELTTDEMPSWLQALPEGDEAGMFSGAAIVYTEDQLIEFGLKCGYASAGTVSQAASIDADPYFCKLLSRIAEFGFTGEHDKALIACIDAYTAAAVAREREEGRLDGYNKGWADASLTLIKAESRAIAAESRLAEIQRGVEGLDRYEHWDAWGASGTSKAADGDYVKRDEILALLQPQGQADTSGLPG